MSYTAKRLVILLMAWGLLVFVGITIRINLNTPPPLPPTVPPTTATAGPDRLDALHAALERDPTDPAALLEVASILYQQKDWAGASEAYRRVLAADPHNVDVLAHLAAAQLYALDMAGARDTLTQAAQLAPRRADVHLLLGLARSRLTPPDLAGARTEWQRVIDLAPNTDLARQAQDLMK